MNVIGRAREASAISLRPMTTSPRFVASLKTAITIILGALFVGCSGELSAENTPFADDGAETSTVEREVRVQLALADFPLTTLMHNNLYAGRPDANGDYSTDLPRRGITYRDVTAAISYLSDNPNRAHGFATFHASAGAEFLIRAVSTPAQKNRPSYTDPVIAVYELVNGKSQARQLPLAIAEALTAPYRTAELAVVLPRSGLYAVAVYHRKKELRPASAHDNPFVHGFRIEIAGNSGRGWTYPLIQTLTIGNRTGEACEYITNRASPFSECHVRPEGCFRAEFVTVPNGSGGADDVEVRPSGCDDKSKLSVACSYNLPSYPGVKCGSVGYPGGRRCMYDRTADQVVCQDAPQQAP